VTHDRVLEERAVHGGVHRFRANLGLALALSTLLEERPMARRTSSSLVYLGIRGRVVALNRTTGDEVWRAELKGSGFVQVARDADYVYATTRGEIFCLAPDSGQLIWNNPLKGLGMDLASIASDSPLSGTADFSGSAASIQRQRAAAAAAAT
jgi:outer membrane protein assembly factor BamB